MHRPSDAAFVGPVAISSPYIGNRPPPQGTCGHSLCTVDGPLLAGCDPLGCVAAACQVDSFCCDLFDPNGWSRSCAFMVGNTFNNGTVSVCPGFTCGGRAEAARAYHERAAAEELPHVTALAALRDC